MIETLLISQVSGLVIYEKDTRVTHDITRRPHKKLHSFMELSKYEMHIVPCRIRQNYIHDFF